MLALNGKGTGLFPVWLMRQAGRALSSYRKLRGKTPFLTFCKDPELVRKATLLPVQELGVDAAILFHDILLPLEGWGFKIYYQETSSPRIYPLLKKREDLEKIPEGPDLEPLDYIRVVVGATLEDLPDEIPLIGFIPGPFTLLDYLTGSKKEWILELLKGKELVEKQFRERLGELLLLHAQLLAQAGVDLLQIFDTWVNRLTAGEFQSYYLPYLQRFIQKLPPLPILYYGKGTQLHIHNLKELPVTGLSCDETLPLTEARKIYPKPRVLQGNFPPEYLLSDRRTLGHTLKKMLSPMKEDPAYIVNLSHGVHPHTPEDHLKFFVARVHEYRIH